MPEEEIWRAGRGVPHPNALRYYEEGGDKEKLKQYSKLGRDIEKLPHLGYGVQNYLINNLLGVLFEISERPPQGRDPSYITEKVLKIEDALCGMAHDGMIRGIPQFCEKTEYGISRKKWVGER